MLQSGPLVVGPRGRQITYFWGDQTMQINGDFEGFPENNSALFGLVSYSDPFYKLGPVTPQIGVITPVTHLYGHS